ncbi:hypothetical protein [Thermovenabulum sp.]
MEIFSEYYKGEKDYIEEYKISPEEESFIIPNIRREEDSIFNFIMFLLM